VTEVSSAGSTRRAASDAPLVAVLGGGQLGWMLGLAGMPLDLRFRFLDPSAEATARTVGELVVGALADDDAVGRAAEDAVVVTYEWEGVPAHTVRALEARGAVVRPGARPLEVAQDRLAEKETFTRLGIGTAPYAAVDDRKGLDDALARIGGPPAILKTRQGGYDGKGQFRIESVADLDVAWDALGGTALIVEAFVAFDRELSVVAVRGAEGDVRAWPLAENRHRDGILRVTRAPAPAVDDATQAAGEEIGRLVADDLGHVGVLAVELFSVGGRLLANELAPRVHNSGHWTIEGAETSQFENHLRAVLGLPLGSTAARAPSAMVNCVGGMPDRHEVLAVPGTHLYDYGKAPRPGRKLGHVTVTAATEHDLTPRVAEIEAIIERAG
jgi:5-(carboxyamino)imidazole ribonucleotide synthase